MNETLVPTQTLLFIRTYMLLLLLFNVHFIVGFFCRAARCLLKRGWVMNTLYELCITLTQIFFLFFFFNPLYLQTHIHNILFQLYLLWIKFHGVCAIRITFFHIILMFVKYFCDIILDMFFTWFFDWYHCWWCYFMIVVVTRVVDGGRWYCLCSKYFFLFLIERREQKI